MTSNPKELHDALITYLVLEPCHVTGMHNPTHTTSRVCEEQKVAALDRLFEIAGLTWDVVDRRLHDDCHFCHNIPADEKGRVAHRMLHVWAGVPIPEALALPAVDKPCDGDDEIAYMVIGNRWESFGEVRERSSIAYGYRFSEAVKKLVDQGRAETRDVNHSSQVRRTKSATL